MSLVTCRLFGQLGNQMYQVAATLAYAWDHQAVPIFPELHKDEDRISYNRDKVFFRLDATSPTKPFQFLFNEPADFSSVRVPFYKDLILNGYFQCWKHFHHHRDRILSVFAPSKAVTTTLQNKYGELLANPQTVSVHVRTWCKSNHDRMLHPFIGFKYYEEAFTHFSPDTTFVVFSDRINWCKRHFPKLGKKFVFIEGNDGVEDLYLMSMMKHNVICNSTYSWWAAYLNQNPDRIVISPERLTDVKARPYFPIHDYFLPEWILLPVTFDHPYPEDMESYNDNFQSLNG